METAKNAKIDTKEILKLISTIFSWTIFTLLAICAIFLLYYFISSQIYAIKGKRFEPKFSLYAIMSPSMTPNIKVYDVIVNTRVDNPEDIKIGDVITFISSSAETNGMTITHRVVSIIKNEDGSFSYQTKGDANPIEDSGKVDFNSIIGKVTLKIPFLGRIQVLVSRFTGWILIAFCVALFIILRGQIKRLREANFHFQGRIGTILNKPLYLPYSKKKIEPLIKEEIEELCVKYDDEGR